MAHTFGTNSTRTISSANPITTASFTVNAADTVLVLMIKTVGGTDRAGAVPTFNGVAMTQANSTQKAASSPECGAELWYLLSPPSGAHTASIPNTGAAQIFYTFATGRSATGQSALDGANGGNNTSTNPTPGAVTTTVAGDIGFAIVASGAQTWAPTAQAGTVIANTDDGAHGGGEQYFLDASTGSRTLNWTFGTSDDWGAVAAFFKEVAPAPVISDTASAGDTNSEAGATTSADTASASDAQSFSSISTATDTATASDGVSVAIAAVLADTGSAAESQSLSGSTTKTDTGTAGDAQSENATAALADTATAGESQSFVNNVAVSDSAGAADGQTFAATSTKADTAAAGEVQSLLAGVTNADTGAGGESVAHSSSAVLADTGSAGDTQTNSAIFSFGDTASAADDNSTAEASSQIEVAISDTATSVDGQILSASAAALNDPAAANDQFLGHIETGWDDLALADDSIFVLRPFVSPNEPLGIELNSAESFVWLHSGESVTDLSLGQAFAAVSSGQSEIQLSSGESFIDVN